MSKSKLNINDQDLKETVIVKSSDIKSGHLKLEVEAYPIHESDFETLISSGTGWHEWSKRFLLISLGSGVVQAGKLIDFFISFNSAEDKNVVFLDIKKYEVISTFISLGLSLVLWLIGLMLPNKKDKLITKIKGHFKP